MNCHLIDILLLRRTTEKIKERKKRYTNTWTMQGTVMPVVIATLRTVSQDLEKQLEKW